MYVKSMVLEGFKSYGKRIEINGFDKEFNAITGFNGTGKSNVLDGICFVLGITNLTQVRATNLQDLVYKSGQAGIKKATVTITFDNRDKNSSPLGYEEYEEITVMRQIVIDGKTKYMINGSTVPNKRVQDMFCSIQLNVNNPHFLIMQGRITKVLNMKPMEILSMVEEAAGTKMYEVKKQAAYATITKKDNKLKEINDILTEDVAPKLAKLKDERSQYIEFQRIERELEHCTKIVVAWDYTTSLSDSKKAKDNVQVLEDEIEATRNKIEEGDREIVRSDEKIQEILSQQETEKGDKLSTLEASMKDVEKRENKLTAEIKSNGESVKTTKKEINQLKSNAKDDENALAEKEKELGKFGDLFKNLKEQDQKDAAAVLAAQERFQKVSAGLLENESGEDATLEQQVINAKQKAIEARTEMKQCEMNMKHIDEQLRSKEKELRNTENDSRDDNRTLENKEKELNNLENEMKKMNYESGSLEALQNKRGQLIGQVRKLQEQIDQFESRHPQLQFEYKNPDPNFKRSSVNGLVCKLVSLKDKSTAYALDVAAGGKLYHAIVDTEQTSKAILQRGQLQRRFTIIPLNKIEGRPMDPRIVQQAHQLVNKENATPALVLIEYPEETKKAMAWVYGQIFIVKDSESAVKVAFNKNIMKRCVTLMGDSVDPEGSLTGGAQSKSGSILLKLEELNEIQLELNEKEQQLRDVEQQIAKISRTAEKFAALTRNYDMKKHEVDVLKQRLQQTTHHKIKQEVEDLKLRKQELMEKTATAQAEEKESTKRHKQLELQLKDASNIRDKQLKDAENHLKMMQTKAENSRREWKKREQEAETLDLEIAEMKKTMETGKEQLAKAEETLVELEEKSVALKNELKETQEKLQELQKAVKELKAIIHQQNKEIQKLTAKKEEINKQKVDAELTIQKKNHEINSIKNNAEECKTRLADLMAKYKWIEQDKQYFGKPGGIYDFEANNPEDFTRKLHQLKSVREKLSRNVNIRAMNLLNKEEEKYKDILKKKEIVETDKRTILGTIKMLDDKKRETLLKAWKQVNADFGSIFSSLLPGANAKLEPPPGQTVLDGLEVKVGFAGVYKESLSELSGGQRSLVALSLILAMLLFKPAPLYILDEVDAALDLEHTENIGAMLKRHFKHSQFIVVSLKDGMFSNANVLFKTRFVDGMSQITRTEKSKRT